MLVAATIMSVSCSNDCLSDLLCREDSGNVSSFSATGESELPECSSHVVENHLPPFDESVNGLVKDESKYVVGVEYLERFQSNSLDLVAREDAIAWILKAQRFYGFQPLTAHLSVNYMDRFLYLRPLPQTNGWPLQLLSVACLSLAAKMEEPLVPSLLDLQVEGAKFIFETKTILRMELLVLRVLDWKLRSITPFDFLTFFAFKVDSTGAYTGILTSRATQILRSIIQEASFLEYKPSCIASAAILCAANEFPKFSFVDAQCAVKWSDGLHKDKINCCYGLMQQIGINKPGEGPKVISQLRVTTRTSRALFNDDTFSSTSSTIISSSTLCCYKRRKLSNSLWANDDKETSD
ncbi:kinase activator [Lithospermum erythrorhizon]|uniref:Kinase activator n=1 Tax=Lithospermum erythrorhizon TaxID=34254 RepID=A0AAV3PSG5_LITER